MNIHKPLGPDCPRCGCNASRLVNAGVRFGRPWADYACDNADCGHLFHTGQERPAEMRVAYTPVRCPVCNSKDVPVQKTKQPIRYHLCRDCGANFSSEEV